MISEHIKSLKITEHFQASPEKVFDYWTLPELARKWLFLGPASHITRIEMNLEPRGKFSVFEFDTEREKTIAHFGKYHVIDRPDTLEFTLSVPEHFANESNVLINFKKSETGCDLELIQTGVDPKSTERSWRLYLDRLKSLTDGNVSWKNN